MQLGNFFKYSFLVLLFLNSYGLAGTPSNPPPPAPPSSVEYPSVGSGSSMRKLFEENLVKIKNEEEKKFLTFREVPRVDSIAISKLIANRKASLNIPAQDSIDLIFHFNPLRADPDKIPLYFEIDYDGKAHLFEDTDINKSEISKVNRGTLSKEIQDKFDKILFLEAEIQILKNNITNINTRLEDSRDDNKHNLIISYSLFALLIGLGLINLPIQYKKILFPPKRKKNINND